MASTSAAGKETWHKGDTCLAPDPRDGTLREATIQRLTTSRNGDTKAVVVFTNCGEEEEDEAVPVSKLQRPGLNHFTQEKPVFPSVVTDPQLCVALELSHTYGHRVPYTINRYLRDYQREGIRFLYTNYMRHRGCILGDDMGLGKTVQIIGFLAAVLHKTGTWEDVKNNRPQFLQSQMPCKQSKPNKVFLIVAPLSVLYNWKDELETWGHFQCVVVHGLRKEEELARIKKGRAEIALTTYETLRLSLDQFNNIEWCAVVVDEAHKIKNPNSQVTQAMKDLNCKVRIGLTGTILQNNLEELWCVTDWAIPGCLGSLGHFKNHFSDPIERGHRHSATKRALAMGRKTVRALVRKISHWFLRRTKALIKEQLPKKDDRVVFCSLTDFQQTVYQAVLDTEDVTLLLRSSEKCGCGSRRTRRGCCYKTNSKGVEMKYLYFSYLAILRKVTNHVALLQSTSGTSKKQEKYVGGICSKVFQKFPDFAQRCKDEAFEALSDPIYSGKMKVLQKLLKFYLQRKDKVLLFSLSTKLLDVLENYCMAEGLDYSRLDGNTKAKERVQIVKDFNSRADTNLCLVSTMAGGVGLNFVGANVVVLFDPTWNPANDLQAIDRAYRIGQCRDVTVLRLISLGTVEEIIYLRQVYKQQLQSSVMGKESARRYFEAVQGHGVHKGELFGIKNLFRLQTQGTCLTHEILEREGRVEAGVMTAGTHTGGEKQQQQEEEEKKKGVSEPGAPLREGLSPDDELNEERRYSTKVPRGVLDFSSGSEDDEEERRLKRKVSTAAAAMGNRGGSASTDPARMTLLQHGFSRLLEKLEGKPEVDGNSSSCVEESFSEEDAEDQKKTSSAEKGRSCLPRSGTGARDVSSSSHRKSGENGEGRSHERVSLGKQSDNLVRESPGLKGCTNMKITVDEESGENSSPEIKKPNKFKTAALKVQRFDGYSDESEDLDLEPVTGSKRDVLHSHDRGAEKGKGRLDRNRKRQSASSRDKARTKYSEDIETFTSSEDEQIPVKKGRPALTKEKPAGMSKAVSFTNVKNQTSPTSRGNKRTIDSVLGGVQEVLYTHSNQRVVGGSRAEELISRAAVRDVFELKMYSQLPANHLIGSIESLPESFPESQPLPPSARVEIPRPDHPVTFSQRSVHHTRHTTFMVGETPQAIRRQQLEEMAATLNFPSVLEFAAEILRRRSSQRLAWLQQYYTSLNQPDLADTVTNNFPPPESADTSSSSTTKAHTDTRTPQKHLPKAKKKSQYTQNKPKRKTKPQTPQNNVSVPQEKPESPRNDVCEPQEKHKISNENVLEPQSDDPSLESEEQEETACSARRHKRTKRGSVSTSGALGAGGCLGLDGASSSGLGSGEVAAFLNRTHRDSPSSADLGPGRSSTLSKPTARGREQEQKLSPGPGTSFQGRGEAGQSPPPPEEPSSTSSRSFLSDLIGDTSILDDLLKPKIRGAPKTPPTHGSVNTCPSIPTPPRVTLADSLSNQKPDTPPARQGTSKASRKDFWDILNEGNEESINKLTDPAEVQRVCIKSNFAAKRRSGEEESKSLWKTNEKFLWKK